MTEESLPCPHENLAKEENNSHEVTNDETTKNSKLDELEDLAKNFSIQKSTTEKGNQSIIIIGVGAAVLLIGFIVYLFTRNSSARQYDAPIPYVWNPTFLKTLNTYLNLPEHFEVLIVTGPKGLGKTRGLFLKIDELIANMNLVFNFDFLRLSQTATSDDLIHYMQNVIENSLLPFDGRISTKYALSPIIALASVTSPIQNYTTGIKDIQLKRIANALKTIAFQYSMNPKLALHTLFEAIQLLSPVVVINNLDSFSNSTFFWSAIANANLPIIVEVTEKAIIPIHNIRIVHVEEFDHESGRSVLVKRNTVFKSQDYNMIYDKVGGNGQAFSTVHELQREGLSISDALSAIAKEAHEVLIRESPQIRAVLKKKDFSKLSHKDMTRLIKSGVLTARDDKIVFTSSLMEKAVKDVSSK